MEDKIRLSEYIAMLQGLATIYISDPFVYVDCEWDTVPAMDPVYEDGKIVLR